MNFVARRMLFGKRGRINVTNEVDRSRFKRSACRSCFAGWGESGRSHLGPAILGM
jgi:hypothetical protein